MLLPSSDKDTELARSGASLEGLRREVRTKGSQSARQDGREAGNRGQPLGSQPQVGPASAQLVRRRHRVSLEEGLGEMT